MSNTGSAFGLGKYAMCVVIQLLVIVGIRSIQLAPAIESDVCGF